MREMLLCELAEINPPLQTTPADNSVVGFIPMSSVREKGGIYEIQETVFSDIKSGFTRFQDEDVLFAKITPCMENGKGARVTNLPSGCGFGSTEFHVLRARPDHDSEYIYQLMQWTKTRLKAETFMSGSAGQQRVLSDFFFRFRVFSPSKRAQKKIARILQTVDRAIEHTEALIDKYQQIKAGLMRDLFTRGIGPDGQLRPPREQAPHLYQQTSIGWIPKEWEPLKLKAILHRSGGYLQTGPFGSQLHSHEYTDEGIPVVMPQDINNGKIDEVQIARITEGRAQSLAKHRLKIGDIIIARRGELSRAAAISEMEQGWVCGTGCFLLRLGGSNLDARFFSMVYRNVMVQRQVDGLAVGSTMPSLNNEIMGKLVFPYLAMEEQYAISDKVQLTNDRLFSLAMGLEKLQKQKSGLMHDLLTGKVSVASKPTETESYSHGE